MKDHTAETPLNELVALPEGAIKKLAELWITSIEQLVAQPRSPNGKEGLAQALGLGEEQLDEILSAARETLGPEAVQRLEAEHPTDKGLGALKPPDEENRT